MDFEDIHNLDVRHMDFVEIQFLGFALLHMGFRHIVVLAVVTLVLRIVLCISVLVVEDTMVALIRRLIIIEHVYSSFMMMPTT